MNINKNFEVTRSHVNIYEEICCWRQSLNLIIHGWINLYWLLMVLKTRAISWIILKIISATPTHLKYTNKHSNFQKHKPIQTYRHKQLQLQRLTLINISTHLLHNSIPLILLPPTPIKISLDKNNCTHTPIPKLSINLTITTIILYNITQKCIKQKTLKLHHKQPSKIT